MSDLTEVQLILDRRADDGGSTITGRDREQLLADAGYTIVPTEQWERARAAETVWDELDEAEQDRRCAWATWIEGVVGVDYGTEWTPNLCNRLADAVAERRPGDDLT